MKAKTFAFDLHIVLTRSEGQPTLDVEEAVLVDDLISEIESTPLWVDSRVSGEPVSFDIEAKANLT